MRNRKALTAGLFALAHLLAIPLAAQDIAENLPPAMNSPELALMGTVPIYWGEADGFEELIHGSGQSHWARAQLERHFQLRPLDFLSAEALANHSWLMLAQPRALSAQENVALDAWVRDGGKLLLFVDPMMTGHSHFAIGDRRRPMDVTLLTPILRHWGLELQFDEEQGEQFQLLEHFDVSLPVSLPGQFVPHDDRFECVVSGEGILAHCVFGEGEVLALADAAMLDLYDPMPGADAALAMLTDHLFGPFGDEAGNHPPESGNRAHSHGKSGDSQENHAQTAHSGEHGHGVGPP